jgi:pyridoxine kinase
MSGLQSNDLDNFSHVLTGYVGSASFLEEVYNTIKQLKEKNPNLIYGLYKRNLIDLIKYFL